MALIDGLGGSEYVEYSLVNVKLRKMCELHIYTSLNMVTCIRHMFMHFLYIEKFFYANKCYLIQHG